MYTKFEYFKKTADLLGSKCEDIEEKNRAESTMKKYLLNKVHELEGLHINSSTEVIQHRKEVVVRELSNPF